MRDEIPPKILFEQLIAAARHPRKKRNLEALQAICAKQLARGPVAFSVASIGRLCEEEGLMSQATLYNTQSSDYRALISAWSAFASSTRAAPTPSGPGVLLAAIEDPAVRAFVGSLVSERDRLRNELAVLKASTAIVIDRRPRISAEGCVALTKSERDALEFAISERFLQNEGWTEGSLGQVTNAVGRRVYPVGYTLGIRRILRSETEAPSVASDDRARSFSAD